MFAIRVHKLTDANRHLMSGYDNRLEKKTAITINQNPAPEYSLYVYNTESIDYVAWK